MDSVEVPINVTPIEHLNWDKFELYVNRAADHPDDVKILLDRIKHGFPESWKLDPKTCWWYYVRHEDDYMPKPGSEDGRRTRLFIDDIQNPSFVAKERNIVGKNEMLNRLQTDDWGHRYNKETVQAFFSLSNEMYIAQMVKKLLMREEAQEIARRFGFSSLQLVEPLVGLTDKKTHWKYMFYEYVDARSLYEDYKRDPYEVGNLETELVKFFEAHGIDPTDLKKGIDSHKGDQLLQTAYPVLGEKTPEGKENNLYLIDIEGYTLKETPKQF